MNISNTANVESGGADSHIHIATIPHIEDKDSRQESTCGKTVCGYVDLGFTAGSTGTYVGFAILVITMVGSIVTAAQPPRNEIIMKEWLTECPIGYEKSCLANQAVLRFSCALVVLYGINSICTLASAQLYDTHWIVKILVYIVILSFFFFINAGHFNDSGYAWFARIGAFLYIVLQQVILLDSALAWNEHWSDNAKKEAQNSNGGLNKWKVAIFCTGFGLCIVSIVAIGLMFKYFGGCMANDVVLSLGIAINVLGFLYQMTCTRIGSVLTSGVMAAYYAFICFSAVTLNPNHECNPSISRSPQTWTTALGLTITTISLSWTCYSTIKALPAQALTGVLLDDEVPYATPGLKGILLSVSGIFVLGSCYYAMVLTNWSTLQSNFIMAHAQLGETALWLQGSASWICFVMYIWSLTAPMIWPERFGMGTSRYHR